MLDALYPYLKLLGGFFIVLAISLMLGCIFVDTQDNCSKQRKDDKKHDRRD